MKNKIVLIVVLCAFLVSCTFLILQDTKSKIQPINCDSLGVVYLKPSELSEASGIADKINGVVVIPELNQVIGRTEVLECPNFEASRYIDTGGIL